MAIFANRPACFGLAVVLALACLGLLGCDGEGLFVGEFKTPVWGDLPGGNESDEEVTPPTDTVTPTVSLGTWVASYGDDHVSVGAQNGPLEYAVRISLRKAGSSLTGDGTMFRVFREGEISNDEVALRLSGTISADDMVITVAPTATGRLDFNPVWHLRKATSRMAGIYTAKDTANNIARAGHAIWYKITGTEDLAGAWVSGFADSYGATYWPPRDRTAALVLDHDTQTDLLSGEGTFVEQREGDPALQLDFNVTRGVVSGSQAKFTFGQLDLASGEMDWFSFHVGDEIVSAYGQFNTGAPAPYLLVRHGHALWYKSEQGGPAAFRGSWVSSFNDSEKASDVARSDYVASLALELGEDNSVTGDGQLLNETDEEPSYRQYIVENAVAVGSRLQMELHAQNSAERFLWDLRIADGVMVGSYQRLDDADQFLSRGHAEWRPATAVNPVATWVACYCDTRHATRRYGITQLALVTISSHESDGTLSGVGAVRFEGEQSRRLFTVSGQVQGKQMTWVWRGTDLFGDVVWRLRQAGQNLYGTYTNYDSAGGVESQGDAMWIRTTQTSTFTK